MPLLQTLQTPGLAAPNDLGAAVPGWGQDTGPAHAKPATHNATGSEMFQIAFIYITFVRKKV